MYGSYMECQGTHPEATCDIKCPEGQLANVGQIKCVCDYDSASCGWDKAKFIRKKGVQCINPNSNPKYSRKRFRSKLAMRSGSN